MAAFQQRFEDLPAELPAFPLAGALLLPHGRLPLHVFEPRYLHLVEDALGAGRLFGMIQPRQGEAGDSPALYDVGCLGRISSFGETDDGRMFITLTGICRFRVLEELPGRGGYRRLRVDYGAYRADMNPEETVALDRPRLFAALRTLFARLGTQPDWRALEMAPDGPLLAALTSLCPLETREKQALLEAPDAGERAAILTALVEMAAADASPGGVRQ